MGDRGNIVIEKDVECFKEPLFFYTHWSGSEIKEILKDALERGQGRWDDAPYLARIIFCEMVQDNVMDETGFGISNVLCDNEHDLLCVNIKEKKVRVRKESPEADSPILKEWTFGEFIELK